MYRKALLIIAAVIAAVAVVVVPSGSAQVPGGPTTLTLFEPGEGSFHIVDLAPKSRVKNPESRKYRFSVGDQVIFGNRVLDGPGGTSQGNIYVKATVMKGNKFTNVKLLAEAVIAFNDGSQLTLAGLFTFADSDNVRVAVTGGTGRFDGASGNLVSSSVQGGEQDTITLK